MPSQCFCVSWSSPRRCLTRWHDEPCGVDQIQDVLAVTGADGKIRSVIQHQTDVATYAFAGSAPGVMQQLFADPSGSCSTKRFQGVWRPCGSTMLPTTSRIASATRVAKVAAHSLHCWSSPGDTPQRSMMHAHYLCERTPGGATTDEGTWVSALDQAAADTAPLTRAISRALTTNERRVARALAVATTPRHSEETAAAVGIKRSSIGKALESLVANADVIQEDNKPRLTDPMFELWLQTRGLTPAAGDDDDRLT